MGYFNFLSNVGYRDSNGNTVIARNILTRGKIIDSIKESQSGYLKYTIKDEERPETLADRIYGRSDYHWIILLFNEILDPFFSWPLSINEMEHQMQSVYAGKAIFIYPPMLFDVDKRMVLDRRVVHFEVGDVLQQRALDGTVLATATIKLWDPNLYKIVVENITGSFSLQGEAARNSSVIGDPTRLVRDIYTVTSEGKQISAPMVRITDDNQYALHHFEKSDGEVMSPLYRPTSLANDGSRQKSFSSLIDRYVLGRVEIIDMGVDDNNDSLGYANSITNISHEETVNEKKRNIKIMRPEYIDPLLRDFRKLFKTSLPR